MNVGARIGVAGDPVPVANDEAAIERLAMLKASLRDGAGKVLVEGDGSALLGHPLDAVLRIANEAKARNWRIKEGDLLSLGSFGRVADFSPGQRLTAVYEGLGATAARPNERVTRPSTPAHAPSESSLRTNVGGRVSSQPS
jgi:2-keto-4-pentenoate hydratase